MPELPEVEAVRREVSPWLLQRTITRAKLLDAPQGPKYAGLSLLKDARIEAVNRRGKFIVCPLSNGHELVIHLGMTGVLTRMRPEKHGRVILHLAESEPVFFKDVRRFGRFCVAPGGDRRLLPTLFKMGPEPLSRAFTVSDFAGRLKSNTAIKSWLLTQRPVAGVGNIYADESLWRAGISPFKPARQLSNPEIERLHEAIRDILTDAVSAGGTTIKDFETGAGKQGRYGQALKVYGRAAQPCIECGQPLQRAVLHQRTTVWCARCQESSG